MILRCQKFNNTICLLLTIILIGLLHFEGCHSAQILVLAPFFGTSHSVVIQSLTLHLASLGHNMTVITSKMIKNPPPNYRQIKADQDPNMVLYDETFVFERTKMTSYDQLQYLWSMGPTSSDIVLSTPEIKDFIQNDRSHFDVVISEMFYQESLYMFAHKYKAPLVLYGTTTFPSFIGDFMGNPVPFTCMVHDQFREFGGIPLYKRLKNLLLFTYEKFYRRFSYLPSMNEVARKHFTNVTSDPLPKIEEMQRNVSLVLLNTHFTYDQVIPLVPGIVEIGGIHIDPKIKALPKDIQKFIDDSPHGVIYFALGSHLKSTKLNEEKLKAFLDVFATLKQRIIWKWEDDNPPAAKNILFKKWLPQFDILGHPNVKAFISHCGMLGTQEAVYHAVPIVGIPIFADQYRNINELIRRSAAVKIDYRKLSENSVAHALDQIVNNGTYRNNMKIISTRSKDRLNTPKETAAYWVEYVSRHRDADFMKSPLAYLNVGQYYFIEIFVVVLIVIAIFITKFIKNVFIFLIMTAKPYVIKEKPEEFKEQDLKKKSHKE